MEKICIAKLRKSMACPGHPEKGLGQEDRAGEERRLTGGSFEAHDGRDGAGRRPDAADRTVSLLLTPEQLSALRSNRRLASSLHQGHAEGSAALQDRSESIVIRFEFEPMPPVRMLKVEEVIRMLRISRSSLSKIIREGMLKSYRFGRLRRIMLTDILSYLEDHREFAVIRPQAPESKPSHTVLVQSRIKEE